MDISLGLFHLQHREYLHTTVESLHASWDFKWSCLHVDAPETEAPGHVLYPRFDRVVRHTPALGCVANWFALASDMANYATTRWVLLSEDDVYWPATTSYEIREFISTFDHVHYANTGFVSPWCSERNSSEVARGDWHRARMRTSRHWCGALSLLIPLDRLKQLVSDWDYFKALATDEKTGRVVHLDTAIGHILSDDGHALWTHTPALVHHLGVESTFDSNNKFQLMSQNSTARRPA